MDFRILGPLEVSDGDRQVALGGARQRALLGMLLLHANEVVSSDRLIDELWPGEGLGEGSKALQVAISRLRKALGAGDLIVTRPPGYQLQVEPELLDLRRFEAQLADGRRLLAEGDPEAAARQLTGALDLWRGEPLADLAYESFCQSEISRLEELRISALEDRVAADLELGRHAELIAELRDLVAKEPLRERLQAQLIHALYRSGRQAEALEAYQQARQALVDGLGIEPGRELQELHGAVLSQDEKLDHRGAVPRPESEPGRGTFVGREREQAELVSALEDALDGRGRLVLVVGEPGIGKSRLADEVMAQATARGARVIVGRCWEAGGAPAYWPWVQALRAYARGTEPEILREQLGMGAGDLAQLLPELRDLFPDLPVPPAPESEGARFRLFEAAAAFLRSASEVGPLVLVLDDLHAADDPSLLMLRFIAREMASTHLLVVCALRDVDPTLSEPLTLALAELARESHCARIGLAGLDEAHVSEYVELSTGIEPAEGLVRAIRAETEGNPLFVGEVVRLLDAEGQIGKADAHLRIPPGVKAVIGQRVGRLSDGCREVLVSASVLGREFSLDALGGLAGLRRDGVLEVLDEAIDERVVGEVPGSSSRLRFGHALIRDTLYDDLSPSERLRRHRDAAAALEAVYASDLEPHLAELAHHLFAAAPARGDERAIGYARRAGDRAASQLAYEEAVRHYEMALTLAVEDAAGCELLLALGDAQGRAGTTKAARESFVRAADLAESLGLPERLGEAAMSYGGRIIWEVSRGDPVHVPLLERALAALPEDDSPLRVRLLARLSGGPLRDTTFPSERKRLLSEQALAMARRLADPGTLAYAIAGYIPANHSPEFVPTQVELATELIAVANGAGEPERAAEGYENRLTGQLELGDVRGAKADLREMARIANELRQPSQLWFAVAYDALISLLEGNFAEAERLIEKARVLGMGAQSWSATVGHRLQLYLLRREQGRIAEVEDLVRQSLLDYPTYPLWRCVFAQTMAELGHRDEAKETLDALAPDGFAALPFDEEWNIGMGLLAEAVLLLEDRPRAEEIYERMRPYADRVAVSYPEISTGCVARNLGRLAALLERWDEAEAHLELAIEVNGRVGARPQVAHSQEAYARMLAARGDPADRERAAELMDAARSAYRELGMPEPSEVAL